VGLHVVRRSGFAPGDTALVFGAGAIGLLVGLWLRALGASRVVMADVREESLVMARLLGFTEAVHPSSASFARLPVFDAVFEAAGSGKALLSAIEKTRELGSVTVVGRDTADTRIPLASFERLMRKEITLKGCWGYNLKGEEETVRDALARGAMPVVSLITQHVNLEEAPRLIADMIGGRFYYCKAMIDCGSKEET
jgi:L-iditol 2-dehydrogenase